jgi:hypothetical protein
MELGKVPFLEGVSGHHDSEESGVNVLGLLRATGLRFDRRSECP